MGFYKIYSEIQIRDYPLRQNFHQIIKKKLTTKRSRNMATNHAHNLQRYVSKYVFGNNWATFKQFNTT